jgi:DNA-binding MurR/RpiR family transcriptional regulator
VFRERIKNAYDSLTPSFRRLAEFILNRELDVAFMTATELAQALDVDAATVVRFSQALGYSGYRELSHEVQRIVKGDLTAAYAHFDDAETTVDQLQSIMENERHNLELAIAQVTDRAAEIVDMLASAKRVWVVGDAVGRCMANLFAEYLRMAGLQAVGVDADPAAAANVIGDWGAEDAVLGIGVAGTGLDTAAVLRFAKEKGAQVAAVSVSAVSPPAQVVDRVLVCPSTSPVGLPSTASLVTTLMAVWQVLLARDKEWMGQRVASLQETYANLLATRAEEAERLEQQQVWREF